MSTSRSKTLINKILNKKKMCELCNIRHATEVHHIIPMVANLYGINLDIEENAVAVCSVCHSRLTNRSLLCNYGIKKAKFKSNILTSGLKFYDMLDEYITNEKYVAGSDILDVFDKWFGEYIEIMGEQI